MRAGIALGSNLGDRLANLKAARLMLEQLPTAELPFLASAVYETESVGCEPNAPRFLNAVIELGYDGTPFELLQSMRQIESALGRPPEHGRNISRTLDLDLLYFGDAVISNAELQLPHPRLLERRFVLEPLHDIRPDLILPLQTGTIAAVFRRLPDTPPLVRMASEW